MMSEPRGQAEQWEIQGLGGREHRRYGDARRATRGGGGGFPSPSYPLLGPVTEIPDPVGGTHFSPPAPDNLRRGQHSPSNLRKGSDAKGGGRAVRVKKGALSCFQGTLLLTRLQPELSSHTLLPSTRVWASQIAVKIPYSLCWPPHPAQLSGIQ